MQKWNCDSTIELANLKNLVVFGAIDAKQQIVRIDASRFVRPFCFDREDFDLDFSKKNEFLEIKKDSVISDSSSSPSTPQFSGGSHSSFLKFVRRRSVKYLRNLSLHGLSFKFYGVAGSDCFRITMAVRNLEK